MATRWTVPLLLLLATGCASTRVVRLDTGDDPPLEYAPPAWNQAVHVDEDAFEEALTRLLLEVPLSIRPAQAGRLVRASTVGATLDNAWSFALRRDYGRWCETHESPGDCLSLLEDGLGYSEMDRLTVALGLAMEPMRQSITEAVEETLSPQFFYAVVVTGLASWVALLAAPEPVVTKAAAVLTAVMVVYLGVGPFLELVKASFSLKQATDRATTFTELEEAGTRFGRVLGKEGARVFILALSMLLGRGSAGSATWLASRLPTLPGFGQAAALGASQVGLKFAAVQEVSAVAVVDETLVITLAPTAVAMTAGSMRGGGAALAERATGPLTPEQQRAIRSLENQIRKHEEKLQRFRETPTPRPGTENLSPEIQQQSIQGRIRHLEREIETFKKNIEKILKGGG